MRLFEPALRLMMVIVYLFTFWHKLNPDFLSPKTSCGKDLYLWLSEYQAHLPFPQTDWAYYCAIYGTLAIEISVPLLLIFRHTRSAGILLALCFHIVLGLAGLSANMFALLILFAPPPFASATVAWWERLLKKRPFSILRIRPWVWIAGLLLFAVIAKLLGLRMAKVFWYFWLLSPFVLVVYVLVMCSANLKHASAWSLVRTLKPVMWIFPVLVFLNGLCPYIGLKTETAYAMYSNLRTEYGQTNHLILPKPFYLFDYQSDLVTIVSSTDRDPQRKGPSRLRDSVLHVAQTYLRARDTW